MKKKTFKKNDKLNKNENSQPRENIDKHETIDDKDLEEIVGGESYGIMISTPWVGK